MTSPLSQRATWLALTLVLAIALWLRIEAAIGGLWTDEAWSVLYAAEAGGPLGVITAINHDNNHHINSWWLQLVGRGASPLAARALSITTSTATVIIVALIGMRRSNLAAIVTALLFALSPIMVLYGAEARGYAPMMLCLALAVWKVDGWLAARQTPFPRLTIAALGLLGSLSHLLMLPGIALIGLWVLLALWPDSGFKAALARTTETMVPAAITSFGVVAMIMVAAASSPEGMRVGGYTPFDFGLYAIALGDLSGLLTGIGPVFGSILLAIALATVLLILQLTLPSGTPPHRKQLYAVFLLTLPVLVIVLQPGNSQFARYHLPLAFGFVLLAGDWISANLVRKGARRAVAAILLTVLIGGNLHRDLALIANKRGDSARPVEMLAARAPDGTHLRINMERSRAIVQVAAWQMHYPVTVRVADCGDEPFLLVDRTGEGPAKPLLSQCNRIYRQIAAADAISASGQSWTLYAQQALPSPKPAVNSAPPRR